MQWIHLHNDSAHKDKATMQLSSAQRHGNTNTNKHENEHQLPQDNNVLVNQD